MNQVAFRGRHQHSLDDKGRLAIPARFKEILERKNDLCVVVTNLSNCLVAFARDDWRAVKEKALGLPFFDSAANIYLRYFISGAVECPLKQGRILIPPDLRHLGGLNKEVVLVGQLKRFEIWDKARWEEEFERVKEEFSGISQSLSDFGF